MLQGLRILAVVFAAIRELWPRRLEEQGSTVLVDVGHFRSHDLSAIIGSPLEQRRHAWVASLRNEKEAAVEFLPVGDLNMLNSESKRYWILDMHEDASDKSSDADGRAADSPGAVGQEGR